MAGSTVVLELRITGAPAEVAEIARMISSHVGVSPATAGQGGAEATGWSDRDEDRARKVLTASTQRARAILVALAEHPGERIHVDELARIAGVEGGGKGVGGALSSAGRQSDVVDRPRPWVTGAYELWMEPSVAAVFRRAAV